MRKLVIPSILAVTVLIAGFFAFSPIEQASTTHTTIVSDIVNDVSGASAIVSSDPVSNTFDGIEEVIHYVILESDVAFTIKDIEIENTIDAALEDNLDRLRLDTVRAFPGEYASTVAGVTDASADDNNWKDLCDQCTETMIIGNDTLNTVTSSLNALENDRGSADNWSFGPNTKIFIQIFQSEDDGEAGDMSSTVTFYLSGPVAGDITITEFEDQEADLDT